MTQFAIQHLSYSAMKQYCANRYGFHRRYVMGIYDDVVRPSGLIGQAGHRGLEAYVENEGDLDSALEAIKIHVLTTPDEKVDWGKTGDPEKCIEYAQEGLLNYLRECPINFENILGVELRMEKLCSYKNCNIPIPLKCYADKVILEVDDDGNKCIDIVDYKFKNKFSDMTQENAAYTIQGMVNMLCCHAEFGVPPRRMIFREIKYTKNRDGGSQIQQYEIWFKDSEHYMIVFLNLLKQILDELDLNNPVASPIPNFWDFFDGQKAWEDYIDEMSTWGLPDFSKFETE